MRAVVNYRKGQKQLKKIALHLKSSLARPPIYDRLCPEKPSTASPGNPVGTKKLGSFLLLVQQDEKSSEESTSLERTYVETIFANKTMTKVHSQLKLPSKLTAVHIAETAAQFR